MVDEKDDLEKLQQMEYAPTTDLTGGKKRRKRSSGSKTKSKSKGSKKTKSKSKGKKKYDDSN